MEGLRVGPRNPWQDGEPVASLCVLRELGDRERRVAVVPSEVAKLQALGLSVVVQSGAGDAAGFPDSAYSAAGTTVAATRADAIATADLVVMVGPPNVEAVRDIRIGCALLTLLPPAWSVDVIEVLRDRGVTSFSFNLVPRTSRAQVMDALSSQAGVSGYRAAVVVAGRLGRVMPMMMTAAGTVPPARVLVVGTGVAGLQAIATARRLGASVSGYDVRPEAAEEIRSLGAVAIELPLMAESGAGGYAAEQTEEFTVRQQELLSNAVAASDAVITTAAVPGRPAPQLISASMVEAMRPGSVIVDLAAPSGGNCELTVEGSDICFGGVTIVGAGDLASDVATSASSLYARNVSNFVKLLVHDGEVSPDIEDEIVVATCVTSAGEVRHEPTRRLMEGAAK
jgi:NAD(P) transhydrogenase subunit alpha